MWCHKQLKAGTTNGSQASFSVNDNPAQRTETKETSSRDKITNLRKEDRQNERKS